jgi:hypothetical protein
MTSKHCDVSSNSSMSSQYRRGGCTDSMQQSFSSTNTDNTSKQHDRSGQRGRPPSPCAYMSTMLGRRHLFQPPVSCKMNASSLSSSKIYQVRRGSLFEQLVAKGVSEELACRRQHMYNRLVAALCKSELDDGD